MKTIPLLKYLQKTKDITRRDFTNMIKEEVIFVNWKKIESFQEKIKIDDTLKILLPDWKTFEEKISYIPVIKEKIVIFNKPKGYVVSKDDEFNKTIFEILPQSWKKDFYYIWRLDKESHWLLLLTNEPSLVDYYEKPSNKIARIYEVKINKPIKTTDIRKAKKWVLIQKEWLEEYEKLQFNDIKTIDNTSKNLRILLKKWKNRHIRKLLWELGYKIVDLKRIKFWKFQLWNIKKWKYQILNY